MKLRLTNLYKNNNLEQVIELVKSYSSDYLEMILHTLPVDLDLQQNDKGEWVFFYSVPYSEDGVELEEDIIVDVAVFGIHMAQWLFMITVGQVPKLESVRSFLIGAADPESRYRWSPKGFFYALDNGSDIEEMSELDLKAEQYRQGV